MRSLLMTLVAAFALLTLTSPEVYAGGKGGHGSKSHSGKHSSSNKKHGKKNKGDKKHGKKDKGDKKHGKGDKKSHESKNKRDKGGERSKEGRSKEGRERREDRTGAKDRNTTDTKALASLGGTTTIQGAKLS
jgi:hypothetical protein